MFIFHVYQCNLCAETLVEYKYDSLDVTHNACKIWTRVLFKGLDKPGFSYLIPDSNVFLYITLT